MEQDVRNESNKFHDILLKSLNNLEGRSDVFIKIYSIHNIESINKSENVVIKASLMNEKMFYLDELNLFSSMKKNMIYIIRISSNLNQMLFMIKI